MTYDQWKTRPPEEMEPPEPEAPCNSDDREGRCDANDGEPCAKCQAHWEAEAAFWRRQWDGASPEEKDAERYARDMREAGRVVHLPLNRNQRGET
jgi:hypothetical protein